VPPPLLLLFVPSFSEPEEAPAAAAAPRAGAQIPWAPTGTPTVGGVLDGVAVVSLASPGVLVSSSSLGLFRLAPQVAPVGRDMFVCAGVDAVDAGRSGSRADAGGGGGAAIVPTAAEAEAAAVTTAAEGWLDILHANPDTNFRGKGYDERSHQPASIRVQSASTTSQTGLTELKETTSGS